MVTAATALGYGACWLNRLVRVRSRRPRWTGIEGRTKSSPDLFHIGTQTKPNEDRPRPALFGYRDAVLEIKARDDLDFAHRPPLTTLKGRFVHLALVLGDGAIFAFRQHHARKCADRFLDDVGRPA